MLGAVRIDGLGVSPLAYRLGVQGRHRSGQFRPDPVTRYQAEGPSEGLCGSGAYCDVELVSELGAGASALRPFQVPWHR
jgi:hypothetical protein